MSAGEGWRFGRRGAACAGCAAEFRPGAEVVSAIYATGETFERRDFCGPCFQDADRRGTPFSWWTGTVPEPEKKKAVFDLGAAKEFLQRLLREGDPSRASLRYLLALLLMRKRAVVLVGQEQTAEGEVLTIRVPPEEDEVHQIPCPELDEAETDRLRDELSRLFEL